MALADLLADLADLSGTPGTRGPLERVPGADVKQTAEICGLPADGTPGTRGTRENDDAQDGEEGVSECGDGGGTVIVARFPQPPRRSYPPADPDQMREGLLAGFYRHQSSPMRPVRRLDWRNIPYSPERGEAFAAARLEDGACSCCAGRVWWRRQGEAGPQTCAVCHPPPPGVAVDVTDLAERI